MNNNSIIGEIAIRLDSLIQKVQEVSLSPTQDAINAIKEEILEFSGTTQFAKHSIRSQRESIGDLLIKILDFEANLK